MGEPTLNWGTGYGQSTVDAMRIYDEIMVPRLFDPWAALMLDAVDVRDGEDVLDVATGPGTVARLAARRVAARGSVRACDLSPAMLAVARDKATLPGSATIDYRECPADDLPFGDSTQDVVICQQGVQFFPDRPAALAEMRRTLREGGRLGIAVWCAVERNPMFYGLGCAIASVFGDEAADAYWAGPWGLPDGEFLASLVADAGFHRVRLEERSVPTLFEGGPEQALQTLLAAPTLAPRIAALAAEGRETLRRAAIECLASVSTDGEIRTITTSNLVTASG